MNERTPAAQVDAGRDLDLLFAQLARLRTLADDPELSSDGEKVYDFSIGWGAMLAGRLPRLAHYSGKGALSTTEQARFDRLRVQLREAAPMIARLSLAKPDSASR